MSIRKSKKIGTTIKGFRILDSRHYKNDTQFYIRCIKCNKEFWKSRGFIKAKAICPYCSNGRNYHNAEGYTNERLYARYKAIINRITTHEAYNGIEMCEEWLNDYLAFREWSLNNGYSDDLQIDRIDNSKGYSPDNCRWVSVKDNQNNKTSNLFVEYNGEYNTVAKLADKYNKNRGLIYQRLKAGWPVKDAFDKEVDKTRWSNERKSKFAN